MRVIIVGGGKVGGYLARQLRSDGDSVIVVEKRPERADLLADQTDALILAGDGTDFSLLQRLEIRPTDLLVALTGTDEVNLVACQLARAAFGAERLLARLNDPDNHQTFTALGIPVVSVTDLLVETITRQLDSRDLVHRAVLGVDDLVAFDVDIPKTAPVRTLSDLALPPGVVLVSVTRDEGVLVAEATTAIRPGDRVMGVATRVAVDSARLVVAGSAITEGP